MTILLKVDISLGYIYQDKIKKELMVQHLLETGVLSFILLSPNPDQRMGGFLWQEIQWKDAPKEWILKYLDALEPLARKNFNQKD